MFIANSYPAGAPLALAALYQDATVLLLGWALGILSSPITDAIRRRSAKQRLTRAVRTELVSLQDALASVVVQGARRHHVLTHSLLEALMTTLRSSGHEAASGKTLRAIDGLLELDERALAATEHALNPRDVISLKVGGAPFLESHLHRLDLYTPETQRLLVEVRAGLKVFDQHASEAMNYHFMTFASNVERQRMDALMNNVETCYQRAAEKASDLVSRIAVLMQSPEMRAT